VINDGDRMSVNPLGWLDIWVSGLRSTD
jgi:hypothetical protein